MTNQEVFTLITLLITILGWSVTAYYQKRILERQIQAENERLARQLFIPSRVKEMEELKNWLLKSLDLVGLVESRDLKEAERAIIDWKREFPKFSHLALRVNLLFSETIIDEEKGDLYSCVEIIGEASDKLLNFIRSKSDQDGDSYGEASRLAFIEALPHALLIIDQVIESVAFSNIQNKELVRKIRQS